MMKDFVTVIFDACGGGITVSSKRLVRGEPYGELPVPTRFGYEFLGWYTAEESEEGEIVDADTLVSAEGGHALYARWSKNVYTDKKLAAYKKKKAAIKRQNVIIAVSAVLALLLVAGLFVVMHFVNRTNLEDVDGKIYKIINKNGVYILCDKDETPLPMTDDGKYYVTSAGSQIKLDASTGTASIYAYVDTVGKELVGNIVTSRILAFPKVEKANMSRIEVHNDHGGFTVVRTYEDTDGDGKKENKYSIEGYPGTTISQEQLASLVVSCGYVLAMDKIEAPIADENGEYSEYGLAAETRRDADGNEYEYTPSWYRISDKNGNEYTVTVGDAIISGAGYYVQYKNPDYPNTPFIYIVSSDIAKTVLQPVESMAMPLLVYPVSLSSYFNVRDFSIANSKSDIAVSFSFVPISERTGTQSTTVPYIFHNEEFKNFRASSSNIDTCLQSFANIVINRVVKLAPDDEALITYGVADPECVIYYKFMTEEVKNGGVEIFLAVSKMTAAGTYYVYSAFSDMIVEVDRQYMPYVEWLPVDWLDRTAYNFNLACTPEITLLSGGKTVSFDIDNSDSPQFTLTKLTKSSFTRTDSTGNKTTYYLIGNSGKYSVAEGTVSGSAPAVFSGKSKYLLNDDGKLFLIEDTSTTALNLGKGTTGTCHLYLAGYDKDADNVLYIFVDTDTGVWGRVTRSLSSADVRVTSRVNGENPTKVTTSYFRHFFQTILYASVDGECNLTEGEMAALRAKPDSEAQLVMTIKTEDGDFTFRFYQYSERRSYMTINGEGEFYILSDRVVKIFKDALKIIAGEDVDATSKN